MSAFWYHFFSNPWVSSGLLDVLPVFILIYLMLFPVVFYRSGYHDEWQNYQYYRVLRKKDSSFLSLRSVMSFRGLIWFWLPVFVEICLLVLGVVSDQYLR